VTLNASPNIEKVSVAINTPVPNAIIVVITFFDNLANRETTQPMSRGLLAIKPENKESKILLELNNHSRLLGMLLENLLVYFLPRANFTAVPNYLLKGTHEQLNVLSFCSREINRSNSNEFNLYGSVLKR
jgi:hypothetical protein